MRVSWINSNIVIRSADKGGGIVLPDYDNYQKKAMNILSNKQCYQEATNDPFLSLQDKLQEFLNEAFSLKVSSKKKYKFIYMENPSSPFFYHLPKVHKDLKYPPGWTVISGINSCTSQLSHYVDCNLQNYVRNLPSFCKDSDSLI